MPPLSKRQINERFLAGSDSTLHYCVCGSECDKPAPVLRRDISYEAKDWTPGALSSRHLVVANFHPALVQSALRSDQVHKEDLEQERLRIKHVSKPTQQVWSNMLEELPAVEIAINKALVDDELAEVVVPVLSTEEIDWIRSVFLST